MTTEGRSKNDVLIPAGVLCLVAVGALGAWAYSLQRENGELRQRIAQLGGEDLPANLAGDAPEAQAAPMVAAPRGDRRLTPADRAAMVVQLQQAPENADRRVWFATAIGDAEAAAYKRELQEVFEEAGWTTAGQQTVRFPIRPGIYFMVADAETPEGVVPAQRAIEAIDPNVTSGLGYREFYQEKRRDNPDWNGFDMTADQSYVIAVGRNPG